MRFKLSTLILAVSLIAIVWALSVLPWVKVGESVSFIQPGKLTVIHSTMRPPTAGEIAVRATIGSVLVFGLWFATAKVLARRHTDRGS